jgi:hypothetical protein
VFGEHKPGRTSIWNNFEKARPALPPAGPEHGIGTPDDLRNHLRLFEESGVDQAVFIQQGGRNQHKHICESLELFAKEVMGEFKAREQERAKQKAAELAPFVAKAMARKQGMKPLADADIPVFVALGRKVAEEGTGTERQKASQQAWAEAAKVFASDPDKHSTKAAAK